MTAMDSDLSAMICRFVDSDERARALRGDDERLARLVDRIAERDDEYFQGLSDLINDKAGQALQSKAIDDVVVCQLAMLGWSRVLESLVNRVELEQENAA